MVISPVECAQRTVLVVEDSVVQRAHLVGLMRKLGFGVVLEAGDGNEALQVLETHGAQPVFLVLTDLEMPGMDGIELTRRLTDRALTENLIVVSARDPRLLEIIESMGSEDAAIGLLGTVPKPVREDDLVLLLERVGQAGGMRASQRAVRTPSQEELGAALARGEFVVHFQPKVSMRSGFIKGVEALARWQHPQHGMLAPLHFLPCLEGSALMAPFTLAIVEQVLRQITFWQQGGLPGMSVSVNLSAENLGDSRFVAQLSALVQAHGVAPSALIWEVTETMMMKQLSQALANLGRLRLMGFGLAMDDYGIGYSSMQQLSRCPFTELKIDRAFVDGASQRPNRRVILESAIDLGRRLGVTTVAEGVETAADWQLLQALGCDMAQGYLLARPMEAGALLGWVRDNRLRLRALGGR